MQRSLRARLTTILLTISITPLLFAAILGIQQNVAAQVQQAIAQQNEVSSRVAIQTEAYINSAVNDLRALVSVYDIEKRSIQEQEKTIRNTLSFSDVLNDISVVNARGDELVKVSRDALISNADLENIAGTPAFDFPTETGEIYYGEIISDYETGLPFMTLGIPITDLTTGEVKGVLISHLRFQAVWAFMADASEGNRVVYMVDRHNYIIAHSNPSVALQGASFNPPDEGSLITGLEEELSVIGRSDIKLTEAINFVVISELPWLDALAGAIRFMGIAIGLIILTIGVIYLISIRLTRAFTKPIEALAKTANEIQEGNLSARVDLPTNDEIGVLGQTFNRMASQLQDVLAGLETRVIERTKELQASLARNNQRTQEVQAIALAARAIATLEDVDELFPNIAELISSRFGFYHVGIFLLDEKGEYAVMRAANSEGGKAMLARNHKLRIGKQGVVGYSVAEKRARIALDVGEDAVFFDNPELPNTHSEMALPLIIGDKVIGVLDIQSEEVGAFSEEDIEILSILADQVAVAIQNARLFVQSQETLAELERTFQQYIRSEWQRFIEVSNVKGFVAHQTDLQPIASSLQKDDKAPKRDTVYQVPVKLRDVVVGKLNVDLDKAIDDYSEDEMDIIHAAVERFALALENARLLETTQRRARREQLVSEVTTKIRSTTDPDEMVKTAMQELKKILGANKVELRPYQPKGDVAESAKDE